MVNYGTIVDPLTALTSKKQPRKVIWTEECQCHKALDDVKAVLCNAPNLNTSAYSQPFTVQTDASNNGVGIVLIHLNENGTEHQVAFICHRLLPRADLSCH